MSILSPKENLESELFTILQKQLPDGKLKSRDQNLASAGMDSLAMVRVLLMIEKEYGVWLEGDSVKQEVWESCKSLTVELGRVLSSRSL